MKIIVDENIPFGREAFSTIGEVTCLSGRDITPDQVRDASVLVVRSVTRVDAKLLDGSRVRVVGTATAGADHLDTRYLEEQGIPVITAAGSNANSVAEYVLTALLVLARQRGRKLIGASLGIVGVGHIGSLVATKATALGLEVILHDPPLVRETGNAAYRPWNEVIQADFVTLHVPLTTDGSDPTHHLFDWDRMRQLDPRTTLINTARGEVVDNQALLEAVVARHIQPPVLDVWEGEPKIAWPLVSRAAVATPHIAGYAFDGKIQGTVMVYQGICDSLALPATWIPKLPEPEVPFFTVDAKGKTVETILWEMATRVYDLPGDHSRMTELLAVPVDKRPMAFDQLRKTYPRRREFHRTTVCLKNGTPDMRKPIEGLGFRLESAL